MNRGEIYWVNFNPSKGSEIQKLRPAMVVSRQPFNRLRRTVMVVPVSSAHDRTEFPLLIALASTGKPSVAVIDQMKAADKSRFREKIGEASAAELEQVEAAIADYLGLA